LDESLFSVIGEMPRHVDDTLINSNVEGLRGYEVFGEEFKRLGLDSSVVSQQCAE
jgi:hypothetical protein